MKSKITSFIALHRLAALLCALFAVLPLPNANALVISNTLPRSI
jgi:hypothetical protein